MSENKRIKHRKKQYEGPKLCLVKPSLKERFIGRLKNLFRFFFKKRDNGEERKKEFSEMTDKERKEFLTNDFIKRMIRVEQRVSSSFGERIPYTKTRYYNGLTESEKKGFDEYIKKEGRKKYFLIAPLFLFGIFIVLSRVEFTGNVVKDQVREETLFFIESLFTWIILAGVLLFILILIYNKIKNSKFEKNFEVLDNLNLKRFLFKEEKNF